MRLLDAKFKYTPSTSTNIVATWKRHGYKPTTDAERQARQRRAMGLAKKDASVVQLDGVRGQLEQLERHGGPLPFGCGGVATLR